MQEPALVSPPRWPVKHRRRVVIVVLLAVLALVGWWWVSRPKPYRLVGSYPLIADFEIFTTSAGFLIHEEPSVLVMHDWTTGRERWRASIARTDNTGWSSQWHYTAEISPDGRYLCIATPAGASIRLQFRQDGRPIGELLLPLPDAARRAKPGVTPYVSPRLFVCNDGRSYLVVGVVLSDGKPYLSAEVSPYRSYLYALNGPEVLATDMLVNTAINFSPDGRIIALGKNHSKMVGQQRVILPYRDSMLARLSIEGKQFVYRRSAIEPRGSLLDGATLSRWGDIYRFDGSFTMAMKPWMFSGLSSNNRHVLYTAGRGSERVRIVDVQTGKGWEARTPGFSDGHPTDDGQAFLARMHPRIRNVPFITSYMQKVPALRRFTRPFYQLYRKPGHPLARLHESNSHAFDYGFPSPDGRTVIMKAGKACLLYRY